MAAKITRSRIRRLLGLVVLVTISIWGCRKLNPRSDNSLDPNWARNWFYGSFMKSNIFLNPKMKRFPDWEKGIAQNFGKFKVVEYPLVSSREAIPFMGSMPQGDKKKALAATFQRLVVAMNPQGHIQQKILTFIPDVSYLEKHNYDASSNTISNIATDYTGLILVQDWNEKKSFGYEFRQGKPIRSLRLQEREQQRKINSVNSINSNSSSSEKQDALSKKVDTDCQLSWNDYYTVTWAGHYEGDTFVLDDYTETYIGSWDFEWVGDCSSSSPPFDPCDVFDCNPYAVDEGGITDPPDNDCGPSSYTTQLQKVSSTFSYSTSDQMGYTDVEDVSIAITACLQNGVYHARVTTVTGKYSQLVRMPTQTEVKGPQGAGHNTTIGNYCDQVYELNALAVSNGSWYMLAAVQAHEDVHASHIKPALDAKAGEWVAAIQNISVPDNGQGISGAVADIQATTAFATVMTNVLSSWRGEYISLATGDHNGGCPVAEHAVVDPMINTICTFAQTHGWMASSYCATCDY